MPAEDKSVVTTHTFDGTDSALTIATVPAGEAWYVHALHIDDPNSVLDGSVDFAFAVVQDVTDYSTGLADWSNRPARSVTGQNISNGTTVTLGAYASGGEEIGVLVVTEPASGTIQLTVEMRRVV